MRCPHCEKSSKPGVIETRHQDDTIVRKRKCLLCTRFFYTKEVPDAALKLKSQRLPAFDKWGGKTQPYQSHRVDAKTTESTVKVTSTELFNAWK